jgi:hypothetical protein
MFRSFRSLFGSRVQTSGSPSRTGRVFLEALEDRWAPAIAFSETFDAFGGDGFSAAPSASQLDSNKWIMGGWNGGMLDFGGEQTTANTDFARGVTTTAEATGGVYAFDVGGGNRLFGIQQGGSDWDPGTLTLRLQNDATAAANPVVAYNIWARNDQPRSSTFNLSYSTDGTNFTSVPAADFASGLDGDGLGLVQKATRNVVLTGVNLAPNDFLYIRWSSTSSGLQNRDELGLDNLTVTATAPVANKLSFTSATFSVDEAAGTATISVARTGTGAGSVDVTSVAGGSATAGVDYSPFGGASFTISWTGSDPDGAVKSITIPIVNDAANEPNETVNLQLANPTGVLTLGAQSAAVLTILDSDAPAGMLLNEISIDPPTTTDSPNEWVELKGTPGTTLNNTYLAYLPGDVSGFAATVGVAVKVVNLSGVTVPANGLVYISSHGGIAKQDAATADVSTPAGSSGSALQSFFNGTGTFLLYWSPAGIVQGTDYDTNNDGTFDVLPAGSTLDSLGFKDADLGDVIYTAAELVDSGGYTAAIGESADAATRLAADDTPNSAAAWYYGNLDGLTATSLSYGTSVSASAPAGGVLTPGAANSGGSAGGVIQIENATYSTSETGAPTLTINVTRTGGTGAVGVSYSVDGGTAERNIDYEYALITPSPTGPLTWANGDFAPKTISVPIRNDMLNEGSETFNVVLSNPTGNAVVGGINQAVVTIGDDDTTAVAVLINELDVAPPGTDNPFEYVEFKGVPATGMGNLYFVGVEGDGSTARGQLNYVHNLSGNFISSNGLAVLKADIGGFPIATTANVIPDAGLASGATSLQNGTNSWLLVYMVDGSAPVFGFDYDMDDDGVFDPGPAFSNATILDAVAWTDGDPGDLTYGGVVLPRLSATTAAATRFRNDNTANSVGAWYYGTLSGSQNSSVTYSVSNLSPGAPVGAVLTPGDRNFDPAAVYFTTTSPLPAGTVGVAYNQTLTATGGTGPYTFAITSGATVPDGFTLGTDGVLSGTPTVAGSFAFEVTARDTAMQTDSRWYTITIAPAATPTTTSLVANPLATTGGTLVSFTATVAPSPGSAGTVTFFDNGVAVPGASNVALSNGVAVFSTSTLAVGSHPITAVYNGSLNFAASPPSNTQTVVVSASGAPQVASVTPNGNISSLAGVQRSRVASLAVAFNQPVQLDANSMNLALHTNSVTFNGASQPNGIGVLPNSLDVTTTDNITWIVTFVGNTDGGPDGLQSLKDGVYNLVIDAAKVHPLGTPGVNMAANSTTTFHRIFGDTNAPAGGPGGNNFLATVNSGDNLQFRNAFNKPVGGGYLAYLDFNGDGLINTGDNLQFRNRFNKTLTWTG